MGWKPKHRQVHYTTHKGTNVVVDEGLLHLLTLLRFFGVETQYSCQEEGDGNAYLVADAKGMSRLIRKMMVQQVKGGLSPEARSVVLGFLKGVKHFELSHFKAGGSNRVFQHLIKFGQESRRRGPTYIYEHTFSTTYGNRITLRLPARDIRKFEVLLEEMLALAARHD